MEYIYLHKTSVDTESTILVNSQFLTFGFIRSSDFYFPLEYFYTFRTEVLSYYIYIYIYIYIYT